MHNLYRPTFHFIHAYSYTVVKNFTTFWVMQASVTIQVQVDHSNTSRTSGGYQCKRRHSSADNPNLNLVRAHGELIVTLLY